MIIQCEQCSTKFRLDDSKVTDKGVKVRCAKCRHVFTVKKDLPDTDTQPDLDDMFDQPQPDFSAMLDESIASTPASDLQQENPAVAASPAAGFDYSDFVSNDFAGQGVTPGQGGSVAPQEEPVSVSVPGELDFGDFDFGAAGSESGAQPIAGKEDAGTFDFGDISMGQPPASAPAAGTEDGGAFDFGGEVNFGEQPAAPFSDAAAEPFTFDTGMGERTDSTGAPDTVAAEETLLSPTEPKAADSFGLGELSFGDEPAEEPVKAAANDQELIEETPAAPEEGTHGAEPGAGEAASGKAPEPFVAVPQGGEEELPPLSIASRRRQSPLFGVLIAVATVLVVAVLGFFGYTMFLEDKGKVVADAGRITVRAVNASFVKNPVIGDLLVITGEAVNGFPKPRAAIQVKGMVYGAGGQVLASKNAYCGNPLTTAQLSTLSLDKLEAAMANQFGDSLANMEVAPGKAIPFVIVIAKPPVDAKDYGVEPAGSTVATSKQQ